MVTLYDFIHRLKSDNNQCSKINSPTRKYCLIALTEEVFRQKTEMLSHIVQVDA